MALALILSPVVVPGFVSVRRPLPGIFQDSVDHSFTDQDAQVDNQEGIHRPAEKDKVRTSQYHLPDPGEQTASNHQSRAVNLTSQQQSASEILTGN